MNDGIKSFLNESTSHVRLKEKQYNLLIADRDVLYIIGS